MAHRSQYILGINAFHADAAAVLLKDGHVVGAIAEERLNRVKHYAGFPEQSIRMLLEMANITIDQVDHIAIGRDSTANVLKKIGFAVANLSRVGKLAKQRLENRAQIRDVPELVARACGVQVTDLRARVHHIEHHLCHAASAFFPSDFEEAAVLSIDGFGDFASTMTATGKGTHLAVLERVYFPHSMGIFYTAMCQFIGYRKYGDEGKVMGLAPYGEPRYLDLMRQVVRTTANGGFELDLDFFIHHTQGVDYSFDDDGRPTVAPVFSDKLIEMFGPPRESGGELTQRDKDIARSMQARLEEVYFHILNHLHARTGLTDLCIAGGVGLNSVANGKILNYTPFRRIYVHPAATDDGTAFGAAFFVHHATLGNGNRQPLQHAYLGNCYTDEAIERAIVASGFRGAVRLEDDSVYVEAAQRIAQGKVVGWFQGRMEWGPRALGARSIVAHPGLPDMKDTLNARIKHREWFRPFAPSILEERAAEYFEGGTVSPFMLVVLPTVPEKQSQLLAVDHVDHTGRVQTVNKNDCPEYYRLIQAFEEITGIPVVLNTSFNENEPVVCTPEQAIDCFMRTKMDALCIGHWLLDKAVG
jgi:carbamoyltransferase